MIDEYGTDALRMTLSIGNTPGNDLKFDEENVKNNGLFLNKLWNATRFVSMNIGDTIQSYDRKNAEKILKTHFDSLLLHERWILSKLSGLVDLTTEAMEQYDFSDAGHELYTFTRNDFCDYYIEEFKLTKESSKF